MILYSNSIWLSIVDQKSHKSKIVCFDNLIIGAISGAASNLTQAGDIQQLELILATKVSS